MTKTEPKEPSRFSGGDSFITHRAYIAGRLKNDENTKSATLFFPKSVKFGFGELSICRICAESRDLGPEHGFRACSFKNKGEMLDFHILQSKKRKQIEKQNTKSVNCWSLEL